MICNICKKEIKGKLNNFGYHLKITHKITYKEYYDSYIKTEQEGICLTCGKETKWNKNSYRKYCCIKCADNSKNIIEKRKNTMNEKYGAPTTLQSNELKEKVKNTCIEKYNTDNPGKFGSDIFNESMIKKYGVKSYLELYTDEERSKYGKLGHTKEAQEKYKQTILENYGVERPVYSNEILNKMLKKYTYEDQNFDSSFELSYYIWLQDNNIEFEYHPDIKFEYEYNNIKHYYYPDFKVNNEYIEIKGLQFFKNKDINEQMINPYNHNEDELYEAKHQCMIKNNIKIITDCKEYIKYVNNKYTENYLKLFKNNIPFPYLNENFKDKSDIGLIHYFHKSIYEATRKNKPSPINAWNNKSLIKKCALNRLKYKGKCTPSDILQGFNVTKIAPKISVFKPILAEQLIKKYLNVYNEIFDPFSRI